MALDASVNLRVAGNLVYGSQSSIGEGSNLLVPAGASLAIGASCYVGRHVELGPSGAISIGDHASIQDRSILVGDVKLGRYCLLSLNVLMTSGRHYFDRWPHLLIRDQDSQVSQDADLIRDHSRPIIVGEDCWLGMNSVVMPGVKIGRGCIVGSNAVVTHDLPPYSVAIGAPARVVRKRLAFQPPDRVTWKEPSHIPYFYSGFELTADERARNFGLEGVVARGDFSLWLCSHGGERIRLRIRSLRASVLRTAHGEPGIKLSERWQDVDVKFQSADGPVSFELHGDPVVVSEAWRA